MPPSPHRFSAAGGAGKSNAAAAGFVKGQQQIHSADLQRLVHGYELGGAYGPPQFQQSVLQQLSPNAVHSPSRIAALTGGKRFVLHGFGQNCPAKLGRHAGKVQPLKIILLCRMKTGLYFSIRSQANAVARCAKVTAYWADQTNIALTARQAIEPCHTAVRLHRLKFRQAGEYSFARNHGLLIKFSAAIHWHKLNKTDIYRVLQGKPGQVLNFVIIETANQHCVDLNAGETGPQSALNP